MSDIEPVPLVLVGGFLGAGKTTLMGRAGRILMGQGKRVGLITNDQASDLVDTEILKRAGFDVKEISGGCFCCRFRDLVSASRRLVEEQKPDILIGEPVGSCTDIAATVLQPLNAFFGDRFKVAPFSVLVDPTRLNDLLKGKQSPLDEKVLYIYGKQLEEADEILINKVDELSGQEVNDFKSLLATRFPRASIHAISALNGDGIEEWVNRITQSPCPKVTPMEVDYDTYADGEALLGWLNSSIRLESKTPVQWKKWGLTFLKILKECFTEAQAEVAHVKFSLSGNGNALIGNLTHTHGQPFLMVSGVSENLGTEAFLILNARVQIGPDKLKALILGALDKISEQGLTVEVQKIESLKPGRPEPTYRMNAGPQSKQTSGLGDATCEVDPNEVCGVIRNLFKPK